MATITRPPRGGQNPPPAPHGADGESMRIIIDKALFYGFLLAGPLVAIMTFVTLIPIPGNFGYPFAGFLFVLFLKGFGKVEHNQRVVKEVFGYMHGVGESGPRWKVPFFGKFIVFPTTMVELPVPSTSNPDGTRGVGVLTTRENDASLGRVVAQTNLGVEASLLFEYPKGPALIRIARTLPAPKLTGEGSFDFSGILNLFEEPIGETIRDEGAKWNYMKLLRERTQFAANVHRSLTTSVPGRPASVIKTLMVDEAGMAPDTIKLTVKHIELPENLREALRAEEISELKLAGTRRDAEGVRINKRQEGVGIAEGRRARYEAAREHADNLQVEALITQSEMAQGNANTIFVPTAVMEILGRRPQPQQGHGTEIEVQDLIAALGALTPAQKAKVLKRLGINLPTKP